MGEVTQLLAEIDAGFPEAQRRLVPLVYDELRRIAASKIARESAALTLQPTALVHEAWLRLGGAEQARWQNRRHFLGAAAEAMRRILIERARRYSAERHGGDLQRVELSDLVGSEERSLPNDRMVALSEALERFRLVDEAKHELVQLRYFTGLSIEEVATTLDISPATAKRWWAYARAWLLREMQTPAGQ
jgi:RNA polymerase sigma factor (TIGR02999 family)